MAVSLDDREFRTFPSSWEENADLVLHRGDCRDLLTTIPEESIQLIVTSPPYNNGKEYEERQTLDKYLAEQRAIIATCARLLKPGGSICWQVGNHVSGPQAIVPLDIALYQSFVDCHLTLRNRIVWHFGHGLHAKKRFSGRYETIMWFTKGSDYYFDLDPVRVPQKYPGKRHYRGPNAGEYSANPNGKNPSDVWAIPNVKNNHVEKTAHPCQFPIELVERLVLSMSKVGDWVLDPYMGVGSTAIAALKHGRKAIGAELSESYYRLAVDRVALFEAGLLRMRQMGKPIYEPTPGSSLTVRQ